MVRFGAGASIRGRANTGMKNSGLSFAGLRPGLGRAGVTKAMRLVGPGGGLNKKNVYFMNQVGGIGRGHSRKCGGPPCNSQRHEDKLEGIEIVPDRATHIDFFTKEIRAHLEKHGLSPHHYTNGHIKLMVEQFLDLNSLQHCMVADHYLKRIRHVSAAEGGCPCYDVCQSPHIVLQELGVLGKGGQITAPGHELRHCYSIHRDHLTLHLSLLIPEEIDLRSEMFTHFRLYADEAYFLDEYLLNIIDKAIGLGEHEVAIALNNDKKIFQLIDLTVDSHARCDSECGLPNTVFHDRMLSESHPDYLIYAEGYSFDNCVKLYIGHMTVYLWLLLPVGIDLNEDGVVSEEEISETKKILTQLKTNLVGFLDSHISAELYEAVDIIKQTGTNHGLIADFYDNKLHHLHSHHVMSCEADCFNSSIIMSNRDNIEIMHQDYAHTQCLTFPIGDYKLYIYMYELEIRETFRELDTDKSGDLSKEELPDLTDTQYNAMDLDGDGTVSLEEHITIDVTEDGVISHLEILLAAHENSRHQLIVEQLVKEVGIKHCHATHFVNNLHIAGHLTDLHNKLDDMKSSLKAGHKLNSTMHYVGNNSPIKTTITFMHSADIHLEICIYLNGATESTLLDKLNNLNACYSDHLAHLIIAKVNTLDSETMGTFHINCTVAENSTCALMSNKDTLYLDANYNIHKRSDATCHTPPSCSETLDLQLDRVLDNKHHCGIEGLDLAELIFYEDKLGSLHLIAAAQCDKSHENCNLFKQTFKTDLHGLVHATFSEFNELDRLEIYYHILDNNKETINKIEHNSGCSAMLDLNTLKIHMVTEDDYECQTSDLLPEGCGITSSEDYHSYISSQLEKYNAHSNTITYKNYMHYSDQLNYSVALVDTFTDELNNFNDFKNKLAATNVWYSIKNHSHLESFANLKPVSF